MTANDIARMIDISSVKAESTIPEIEKMAEVAKKYEFICAFAMPCFTKKLVELLSDTDKIMVGGVVGFPSGADTTSIKIATAKEMIDKAHENGIICNVFWSDDEAETRTFLDMGIDVILTNDYHRISGVVAKREKYVTYR